MLIFLKIRQDDAVGLKLTSKVMRVSILVFAMICVLFFHKFCMILDRIRNDMIPEL